MMLVLVLFTLTMVQFTLQSSRLQASARPVVVAAAAGQTACSQCENKCAGVTQQCKNGSIKSCYLAAVCLCQCNLDAGGCGSSTDALKQCVRDNQKSADALGH
jgi:hypothetical protein